MNNTELIARAICQNGKCTKCDADCIDYRAAERVVAALKKKATNEPHWTVSGMFDDFLKCPCCGESWPWQTASEFNYCPKCGDPKIEKEKSNEKES